MAAVRKYQDAYTMSPAGRIDVNAWVPPQNPGTFI